MNCFLKGIIIVIMLYLLTETLNKIVADNTINEFHKLRKWNNARNKQIAINDDVSNEVSEEIRTIENMASDTIETFNNKKTITLFYGSSCPASLNFMPTWERIKNTLPSDVDKVEVECYRDKATCKKFNIKLLPTVLITNGVYEKQIPGNMPSNEIYTELRLAGITFNELNEPFSNDDTTTTDDNTDNILTTECDNFWFEKQQGPKFCIKGGRKIYGCSDASRDSKLTPFMAAHSVFGAYINTCGRTNGEYDDSKLEYIGKIKHKHSIDNFELNKNNGTEIKKTLEYTKDTNEDNLAIYKAVLLSISP
jgi:hypothetical protein